MIRTTAYYVKINKFKIYKRLNSHNNINNNKLVNKNKIAIL